MSGEKLRGAFADKRHANGVDQASESGFLAGGDFVEKILGGLFGHAIEIGEGFEIQAVKVGEILDQFFLEKLNDDLIAEAVNIHGVAAGKMEQRFPGARGTRNVDATVGRFALGVMHAHPANRTLVRHLEFFFFRAVLHDFQNVGDDFSGAFDEDGIAGVDIEAADFVEIVQRGFDHSDAADLYRLENRERSQNTGAADADHNVAQQRGFLMGLIFVGDGPARRFGGVAQFILQADFVDLHDDAVNIEPELFALGIPFGDVLLDFAEALAQFPVFADFKTHGAESFENFGVAFFGDAAIDQ